MLTERLKPVLGRLDNFYNLGVDERFLLAEHPDIHDIARYRILYKHYNPVFRVSDTFAFGGNMLDSEILYYLCFFVSFSHNGQR